MNFVAISDIHIKHQNDDRYPLLLDFMKRPETLAADKIFFLGDIFDLVIGGHPEYYDEFKEFFNLMIEHSWKGKEIRFFEGNHDFHLEEFFRFLQEKKGLKNFYYHKDYYVEKIEGKHFVFSHGDLLDVGNTTYMLWKKAINNPLMKLVTTEIWTFDFVQKLGNFLSKKSRARNTQKYENPDSQKAIREIYRKAVIRDLKQNEWDVFICGHSHVKEEFHHLGKTYFNCGFLPTSKVFMHYRSGELVTENLS